MTAPSDPLRLPLVHSIDLDINATDLFRALEGLPGRIWLDSATAGGAAPAVEIDDVVKGLSRYSFLSADPIHRLVARPDQPNPWGELSRLCAALPQESDLALPPFQGGIVGVIGYEAARWLEPAELASCHLNQQDDLPTPAFSFAVYDWTLAIDHSENRCWLITQGFTAADLAIAPGKCDAASCVADRIRNAMVRAEQIKERIAKFVHNGWGVRPEQLRSGELRSGQLRINQRRVAQLSKSKEPSTPIQADDCEVESNFTSQQFRASVAEIVRRIHNGDSFQVNLAQRLTTALPLDPAELYLRLRTANPAPFAGFFDGGSFQVLSSSPEGFLKIRDRHVETRPIKGTVARTGDAQTDQRLAGMLLASEKDRAENIMIVDLMRNDLSRVCKDESIVVSQMCEIERYQFVQHLVSVVQGDLVDGVDGVDVLMACFPGGSVTGAPKIEAMKTIAELEPNPRGPYCGSMGYLSCGGGVDFNILIRTITCTAGQIQIPVGGGITARSIPAAEEAETWAKAKGMLDALPQKPLANSRPAAAPMAADSNPKISETV